MPRSQNQRLEKPLQRQAFVALSQKYVTILPPIHPVSLRSLQSPTFRRSPRSGAL